jgi:hypothetical protein
MMADYYAQMKANREALNLALLPCAIRVGYVGECLGAMNVVWHFGSKQTGFAAGATPEAVVDRIQELVFGGL